MSLYQREKNGLGIFADVRAEHKRTDVRLRDHIDDGLREPDKKKKRNSNSIAVDNLCLDFRS